MTAAIADSLGKRSGPRKSPRFATARRNLAALLRQRRARATLAPRNESHGTEREPAERTLVGSLFITPVLAVFASCDRFTGVGVSVVYQLEGVGFPPVHSEPCPPILNARAAIELKTDKAHAGIVPLPINAVGQNVGAHPAAGTNKTTRRYILAKAQF